MFTTWITYYDSTDGLLSCKSCRHTTVCPTIHLHNQRSIFSRGIFCQVLQHFHEVLKGKYTYILFHESNTWVCTAWIRPDPVLTTFSCKTRKFYCPNETWQQGILESHCVQADLMTLTFELKSGCHGLL